MGTFEARRGRWGVFTDFIYLDVSGDQNGTRNFSIGGHQLPASLSANLDLGIKGTLWTIAGEYLAVSDPSTTLYVLGGARMSGKARSTMARSGLWVPASTAPRRPLAASTTS